MSYLNRSSSSNCPRGSSLFKGCHGYLSGVNLWIFRKPSTLESFRMPLGCCIRDSGRSPSWSRAGGRYSPSASHHLENVHRRLHHHAGGGILWCHVWRVHHLHTGEYPRGVRLGGDLSRWLPDGPKGEGRARSGHFGHWLLCRWNAEYSRSYFLRTPPGELCSQIRCAGILLSHTFRSP